MTRNQDIAITLLRRLKNGSNVLIDYDFYRDILRVYANKTIAKIFSDDSDIVAAKKYKIIIKHLKQIDFLNGENETRI